MSMDLGKIVTFTNITDEPFTHNYQGVPFTVEARESKSFPYDLGRHLAKHLARKILFASKEDKRKLLGYNDQDIRNDVALFTTREEGDLIQLILGEVSSAPVAPELSEAERIKQRVEDLNANKPEDAPERTKKDVIEEMEAKGLNVDKRKSLDTLLEELKAAE